MTGLVVGKSYSEQKAEAQETQAETPQPQQYTPEQIAKLKELGITDEELSQAQANGFTYEEALKETRAQIEAETFPLIQLIKVELHAQLKKHDNGEETPYNSHFEELKTKQISPGHYSLYAGILEEGICRA